MATAHASEQRKGVLLVAAAALLWSSGGLFIKLAPMPGLAVAFGRSAVTSVFYLIVLRPKLSKASWSTAFAYAAMILTFVTATKLTTSANAIFLQYTGPAYVLMLSPWILRERLKRIDVACVVISLVGMSLFFLGRVEAGQLAGNLLGAASGLFFGVTVLLLRRDAAGGKSRAEGSLVSMLEPVFNPLWVFLGTGERPGPWALLGGGIVIGAVVVRALWREPAAGLGAAAETPVRGPETTS